MKAEEAYVLAKQYTDDQMIGAGNVTGVKGDAESEYRAGKVNITAHNVGAYTKSEVDQAVGSVAGDVTELQLDVTDLDNRVTVLEESTEEETKTVTGNPIIVTDADNVNARGLSMTFEPQQDLHGYDKPWVGGAGKNLFNATVNGYKAENTDGTWSGNTYTLNGVSFALNTDSDWNVISINVNGANSNSNTRLYCPWTSLPANTTYTLNGVPSGYGGSNLALYLSNSQISLKVNPSTDNGSPVTFTTVTAGNVRPAINVNPNVTINNAVCYPQLELGSTATSFEPYSNICPISGLDEATAEVQDEDSVVQNTATIDLNGTRYGFTVDFVTGELVVNKGINDLGDLTWTYSSDISSMVTTLSGAKPPVSNTDALNALLSICQAIPAADRTTATGIRAYMFSGETTLYIRDSGYTDATAFKTAMTGQTIVYELATPITVQLTPTQLELLRGYNNIFGNGKTITLTYKPDTLLLAKEYTDEQIALLKKLPNYPSEDGTYTLSLTVADGVGTLSWVSE